MKYLALVLVLCGVGFAQVRPSSNVTANRIIRGSGAPSGGCGATNDVGKVYINYNPAATFSTFYVCSNTGVATFGWELGGGSSTPISGASTNALVTAASATTLQTICATCTLTAGGLLTIGSIATGSLPPSLTAGTGGAQADAEGTVPSVCATSGVDCVYADATQHGWLANFNNGGYKPLIQGPTSSTDGNCPQFSGTNGGLLVDSGAPCSGSTPAKGGGDFLFGIPSYTNTGAGYIVAQGSLARSGASFSFVNRIPTSTHINYTVTAAGAAGTGIILGIYSVNTSTSKPTTALCVANGSSTNVEATGVKTLAWSSGANVSAGTCTLTIGSAYAFVMSSEDTTLAIMTYGDSAHILQMNVTNTARAGYASAMTTGSGGSLAFTTLSGLSYTASTGANSQPVIYLEN